jgi:caffeoyl-CoA O-methyltransferase
VSAPVTAPGAARPVTPLGIVVARLAELVARGGPVDPAELRAVHDLAAGIDPYVERHTTPESPALRALAQRTARHDWRGNRGVAGVAPPEQEMLSGHVEGRFLAILARAVGARRVLEIGMFTGYAALALAEALPPDGRVVTCELDPEVAALARDALADSGHADRIDVRVGPAADTLAALAAEGAAFDLVFVDADKAGYAGYLSALLDTGLLAPGGLVCVDNTLMQGQPWTGSTAPNAAAIAAFNDAVTADPRVEQVLLPVRDGITLVLRR